MILLFLHTVGTGDLDLSLLRDELHGIKLDAQSGGPYKAVSSGTEFILCFLLIKAASHLASSVVDLYDKLTSISAPYPSYSYTFIIADFKESGVLLLFLRSTALEE